MTNADPEKSLWFRFCSIAHTIRLWPLPVYICWVNLWAFYPWSGETRRYGIELSVGEDRCLFSTFRQQNEG